MTVSFCPEPLTLSFLFSGMLNLVIRLSADLEMQMNAMARVEYYKSIETESYDGRWRLCASNNAETSGSFYQSNAVTRGERHWTRLVIVKDQYSHIVYINIYIK